MNTLVAIYQSVPHELWIALFGGSFIAGFVQLVKKLFGVHGTFVIHTMTITTAFLATTLPSLLANHPVPPELLGAHATAFYTGANLMYAAVKALTPFWAAVKKYEDKKAAQKDELLYPSQPAVSSVSGATTTHIPVQSDEYDG